jgi:aryl-alcohol dehydrogenase-like predicted oxidoreductase
MIAKQPFGSTGHMSTRTIFGAAAFGGVTQDEADRTIELLLEYGVNHIDTAASYGESEVRLGPPLRRYRRDFFLATKTGERTYAKAREQIHRSLDHLGVDSVDLLQLHCLVEPAEWDVAMGPGGAIEALVEAREQKLARFLGVTGHGLSIARMHLRSLARFDFDSVLFPYSYILLKNADYASGVSALLQECERRRIAVQTIKAVVHKPWGNDAPTRSTWYRPLEQDQEIDKAVHWVLGRPGVFLNTAGDIHLLPTILESASRFESPPAGEQMEAQVRSLAMAPLFVG